MLDTALLLGILTASMGALAGVIRQSLQDRARETGLQNLSKAMESLSDAVSLFALNDQHEHSVMTATLNRIEGLQRDLLTQRGERSH